MVCDTKTREREDRIESDISPVIVSTTVDERSGRPDIDQACKIPKPNKKRTTERTGTHVVEGNGESRKFLKPRSGCKNSQKIWLMMKFVDMETLSPVPLMKCLQSPHSRDVRIWVSTVFILISLETEIARSVRGQKLQGPRAGDAMVNRTSSRKFW